MSSFDKEKERRYYGEYVKQELDRACKETTEEVSNVSRPKVQKVPQYMAARVEFEKFYVPQLIHIGLLHYCDRHKRARYVKNPHKYEWTAMYVNRTNQTIEDLYQRILPLQEELFEKFTMPYKTTGDDRLLWLLVLDGCSILQVLEKYNKSDDAGQELNISLVKLVQVHQDLLILDNQIPFQALRLLCNDETRLKKCLQNFLKIHGINPDRGKEKGNKGTNNGPVEHKVNVPGDDEKQSIEDDPVHNDQQSIEDDPVHLLDYLRRALLMRDPGHIHEEVKLESKNLLAHLLDYLRRALLMRDPGHIHEEVKLESKKLHLTKYRIGTVRELKAAGIRVKKDPNNTTFYPSFSDTTLYLPELTVDGSTALIFLNLIAYEMCPDFRNGLEITSYVVFMSSLIDQPQDVKELISAGILINELANDKQVADLFNKMDSVLVPETERFAKIRDEIHKHFRLKGKEIKILEWMGEAYETFLRSPWTIIALLAGSLGLVLTFIQTWFAIHPKVSSTQAR